uniref:WD domain, G-beta repeat containing protein n=1 Tax=Babesia bovis TaxID=5865 RepID=S6B7P0_BABBO|nr:hypothetical protein [Babesia bovis]
MSHRTLQVSTSDTAPPLTAGQCLWRLVLATHLANRRLFSESSSKKTPADMPRNIKSQHISLDSVRIKSKLKDLCYNCDGSRWFVASRESVYILDVESLSLVTTISAKCIRVLTHPTKADTFALVSVDGTDHSRPCVKVFTLPFTAGVTPSLLFTAYSTFDDVWYSRAWSPNRDTIAVLNRSDRLQRVDATRHEYSDIDPSSAISLSSEVYGLVYTSSNLVLQKVDGCIDVLTPDFVHVTSEQLHSHIVLTAGYNRVLDLLATGGSDHTVQVVSCKHDYTCIGSFFALEGKISSLSFSHDGMLLAWGTKDTLYTGGDDSSGNDSAATGEYYLTVAGTNPCEIYLQIRMPAAVTHVQFCPDGYTIAYACDIDNLPKGTSASTAIGLLKLC